MVSLFRTFPLNDLSSALSEASREAVQALRCLHPRIARPAFLLLPVGQQVTILALVSWIVLVIFGTVSAISYVYWLSPSQPSGESLYARPNKVAFFEPDADAILQRPVFSRSRKPSGADLASVTPRTIQRDHQFALKGVFIDQERSKAFLTSAQNPIGIWLGTNDEISGWRIVSITATEVTLATATEQMSISMEFGSTTERKRVTTQVTQVLPARFGMPPTSLIQQRMSPATAAPILKGGKR